MLGARCKSLIGSSVNLYKPGQGAGGRGHGEGEEEGMDKRREQEI